MATCLLLLAGCTRGPDAVDEIQAAGVLRAGGVVEPGHLTPAGQAPRGYTAALVSALAADLGVRTHWRRFARYDALCQALVNGDIDIATGVLTTAASKPCRTYGDVAYGPHLERSALIVAYRHGHKRPRALSDLADLRVALANMAPAGTQGTLQGFVPSLTRMQRGLAEVAALRADASLAIRSLLDNMQSVFPRLALGFDTGRTAARVWVFRRQGSARLRARTVLLARSDDSMALRKRELAHRGLANRAALIALQSDMRSRLPALAPWFADAARRYGLDPHLLCAMGYQESHWRADARSPTGVRGLMMLTRATARRMGVINRLDARQSIDGGARYLAHLLARLARDIPHAERTWFALASYNLGPGHVRDVRAVTATLGGNPSRWLDVATNLPLLESPAWRTKLKYGFARGTEAVRYVANIRHFYDALAFATQRARLLDAVR